MAKTIFVKTNNPFHHVMCLSDGRMFVPEGRVYVSTQDVRAADWNPVYWSRQLAPRDRAVLVVGLEATRGARKWPKGSRIPAKHIADRISDFRAVDARAGGATVVSSLGRWYDHTTKTMVREPSVSVTILREPHETWESFVESVKRLAMTLTYEFGQYTVYVDFIRDGHVIESRKAYWRKKRASPRVEERL
jgi:hypothetical protein